MSAFGLTVITTTTTMTTTLGEGWSGSTSA
ncbi:MAG: hypothetical protein QOF71_3035 [Candidatus Eremiobacteraeota bacterium]|jgi:hypothetical protein|nr:hypothetical protein [Candidatus Eremiobacteraeota bacterium]